MTEIMSSKNVGGRRLLLMFTANHFNGLIIIFIVCVLSACGLLREKQLEADEKALRSIDASIEYLGPDKIALAANYLPDDVVLLFPYIAGGIFGNPVSSPLFVVRLTGRQDFTLDLAKAEKEVEEHATMLNDTWLERGLTIKPTTTRLARVGTFAFDAITRKEIGAGGFIDGASRDYLTLVYVDRACHINGSFVSDKVVYKHDIYLSKAGFHWIRFIDIDKNTKVLKEYDAPGDVRFSIELFNLRPV